MTKMQYSKKKIEETLIQLYANKGDLVKTSEETGVHISDIHKMKREALRINDIIRVKQSKEFLEVTHRFLIQHIKSKEFKEQVRSATLKEVTELIIKLIDKLKEYQDSLGIAGLKLDESDDEKDRDEFDGKTRKPEELGRNFSLIGSLEEEEKSNEVTGITPPESTIEDGADIFDIKQ